MLVNQVDCIGVPSLAVPLGVLLEEFIRHLLRPIAEIRKAKTESKDDAKRIKREAKQTRGKKKTSEQEDETAEQVQPPTSPAASVASVSSHTRKRTRRDTDAPG